MQYVTDAKSENELSILGFGCMRFPLDKSKTEQLIVTAVEAGVNYFDTGYIYGNSEATLGDILTKHGLRNFVYIATKLPHQKCKEPGDLDRIFQEQLDRLKSSVIDYYLIHNLSNLYTWEYLCDLGIEEWIAQKKKTGEIRQIGFSFHGTNDEFMKLIDIYDWDLCQIQYNYMDENYQAGREGLRRAHEKGIMVVIMEPLLGGKLANGLPAKAAKIFKEADSGYSPATWAFRWLWNQPEVSVVLSGMNSMDQLQDNLNTAKEAKPGMLSEKEAATYVPVISAFREAYRVPCTGCNYCMPCPRGVNIPGCFAGYNTSYALGFVAGFTQYLTSTGANGKKVQYRPSNCVSCGECEKKCPQHIEIPKTLLTVKKRMEPFWFKPLLWIVQKFMG